MYHERHHFAHALAIIAALISITSFPLQAQEKAHSRSEVPADASSWNYAVRNGWHVLFEGHPLGQPYEAFLDGIISEQGFELLWKTERTAVLRGNWKGFPETKIVAHNRDGVCYMVEAYPKATLTAADAMHQYDLLRGSLADYANIDPLTLEAYTVHRLHRLKKRTPDAYSDRELSNELDSEYGSWQTLFMLPEGNLRLEILGRHGIGNAYARYRKGRFQVHAVYRDNHESDRVAHIDYLHPEKSWHN